MPRPQVFAHPVSLRRKSAARRSADLATSQRLPTLDSSPSLPRLPSARFSPSLLGMMKGNTPFNEDSSSGRLVPMPSLRRASGALPPSVFLDDSGVLADDEGLLGTPSPDKQRDSDASSIEIGFNSTTFDGPSPWTPQCPHATWTGCLDSQDTDDGQLSSHEFRDLQRHFVSNLLPGSLARVSLQRHSASARQDVSPYTAISPYTAPAAFHRTKSQPAIESEEQQQVRQQGTVRRSASLHSLRDVLGPPALNNNGTVSP